MRLSKAISGVNPITLLFSLAIIIFTLYSVHMFLSMATSIVNEIKLLKKQDQVISIASIAVYSNGSIDIVIDNNGAISIENIYNLDIVVIWISKSLNKEITYRLTPIKDWIIHRICAKDTYICFEQNERIYLRPGEIAFVKGAIPNTLEIGSWGYIVIITPTGYKYEKVFVVEE